MTIVLKTLSVFLLAFWPIMAVTSVMMFGGPGATNDKRSIRSVILLLYYPVLITGIYWITGAKLFGIDGQQLLINSAVFVTVGIYALGYFKLAANVIRGINNEGYSVVNDKVYYNARHLPAADAATFRPVEEADHPLLRTDYYRDKHRVYYKGMFVRGVNPSNFRRLAAERMCDEHSEYWGDDSSVVYEDEILEGANPHNFQVLPKSYMRSDGNIYHYGRRIEDADAPTFEVLAHFLAKDKNRIYYGINAILPEADTATFRILDPAKTNSIAIDASNAYFIFTESGSHCLEGVDIHTLEILDEGGYIKDAAAVYRIEGQEVSHVPLANPSTFETVRYTEETPYHATDGAHCWLNGALVE